MYMLQAERAGELVAVHGAGTRPVARAGRATELYAGVGTSVLAYTQAANKLGYLVLAGDARGRVEAARCADIKRPCA